MHKLGVLWTIAVLCTPSCLTSQVITGRVLESSSDHPIAAASVTLLTGDRPMLSTETDSTGTFRLGVPGSGRYSLRVERIGYATANSNPLDVGARESVAVTIRLSVTAVRLERLLVVERREEIGARSDFERRMEFERKSGSGVFITRDELESTTAHSVTALLTRVPLLADGPVSFSQGGCTPTLYLNGARFAFATGETIDHLIQPGTLEGIEIYRNRTELPREFAGIGHCGAIIFWTRAGNPSGGAPWRLLVAGGALLGLVVLFITN